MRFEMNLFKKISYIGHWSFDLTYYFIFFNLYVENVLIFNSIIMNSYYKQILVCTVVEVCTVHLNQFQSESSCIRCFFAECNYRIVWTFFKIKMIFEVLFTKMKFFGFLYGIRKFWILGVIIHLQLSEKYAWNNFVKRTSVVLWRFKCHP